MNKAASIRQKLLNISKEKKVTFQTIIFRYLHERLLYRLSQSKYRNNFFLKGGVLIYTIGKEITRPTKDIDFLGHQVPNNLDAIHSIFKEVCIIGDDDAVTFDVTSIKVERIKEEDKYEGIRVHIDGGFDTIKQSLQIDIGFGDIIIPKPQKINFPLILKGNSPVKVQSYTIESIIAEKFHSIVVLSFLNSRMKDFYDVYYLIKENEINNISLKKAINQTFENRETPIDVKTGFFRPAFAKDETLNKRWKIFLKRNRLEKSITFEEAANYIRQTILVVLREN